MNREIKFRAWLKDKNKMIYWNNLSNDEGYILCGDDSTTIDDNDPVMEYTGLKDKTGQKIYEGDICKIWLNGFPVVVPIIWNEEKAQFGLRAEVSFEVPDHVELFEAPEVVGNIYENPELLKENK